MFDSIGLKPIDPRVLRPGPPRFFGDWVDTVESQRLLKFQRHSLDDILHELRSSLGPMRWLLRADRKSVVSGKSVSVRVDLGGRRIMNNKNNTKIALYILH